jgi:P-type Cu2+ transporter
VSIWSGAQGATRSMFHWLSALIALPTVAYSGQIFFRSAWTALRNGRTNMDVPISIGVLLTTGMSLFETIIGGAHAWFDGAVMLMFFLLAGRWMDNAMRRRARDGVTALLRQTAPGAFVRGDGSDLLWTPADALRPGMVMEVAAGERFAADGTVLSGSGSIDMAFLTGESTPQAVARGDAVHAGALNVDGALSVTVTAVGRDTSIADIARMMEQASQSKSRYVRIADRAARLYAPAVHALAALSFAGWMMAGAGVHQSLLIAAAVLLITCPCALGLAVPAAQIVACGALMRKGVLIKDGSTLERLSEATFVLFDKTGTLTLGRPEPVGLDALTNEDRAVIRALAQSSRHPLSMALRRALENMPLPAIALTDMREVPGQGVHAMWNGRAVSLGRPDSALEWQGLASAYHRPDGTIVTILFEDRLRPNAAETIAAIKVTGLDMMIASGDRLAALQPIATTLGLTAVPNMLPGEKMALIDRLRGSGEKVLMVGDGLNDGPALAAGHVSLAPSSASDASQLTADAVYVGDSLMPVAIALRVARQTMRVVRQNFAIAVGYNVLAVPLAIGGMVTPLIAALAMSGSSLIVVANALRLKRSAS